jgi:hypothetical protein
MARTALPQTTISTGVVDRESAARRSRTVWKEARMCCGRRTSMTMPGAPLEAALDSEEEARVAD